MSNSSVEKSMKQRLYALIYGRSPDNMRFRTPTTSEVERYKSLVDKYLQMYREGKLGMPGNNPLDKTGLPGQPTTSENSLIQPGLTTLKQAALLLWRHTQRNFTFTGYAPRFVMAKRNFGSLLRTGQNTRLREPQPESEYLLDNLSWKILDEP